MARYNRDVFEFIDEDADEWLETKDVLTVFKDNKWPTIKGKTPEEMVGVIMDRFSTKKKGHIDFIEFCGVIEYLWSLKAVMEYAGCKARIEGWIGVIDKVFKFIDVDEKGAVTSEVL